MGVSLIYGVLVLVLFVGIILVRKDDISLNMAGFLLNCISGIGLILLTAIWILNYSTEEANVQEYYAIKSTITQARSSNISDIERAALTTKIIEVNQHLADVRYWNNTIWRPFYPEEEVKLEYLK